MLASESLMLLVISEVIAVIVCSLACHSVAPRSYKLARWAVTGIGVVMGLVLGYAVLAYMKYAMHMFIFFINLYILFTVLHEALSGHHLGGS